MTHRQGSAVRRVDGGARQRADDTSDQLRAVLRDLRAAEGRLRLHQGARHGHLPAGLGLRRHLHQVTYPTLSTAQSTLLSLSLAISVLHPTSPSLFCFPEKKPPDGQNTKTRC